MRISITLSNGKKVEKTFDKPIVSIGRSVKADFQVLDESLSRHHCQIELTKGEFFIMDLGSANGVFLDGDRIPAHTRTKFTTFLQLSVGPLDCVVSDFDLSDVPAFSVPTPIQTITSDVSRHELIPTKPTRKINSEAFNTPFGDQKKTKATPKRNIPWFIPTVAVLLVTAGFYFSKREAPTEEVIPRTTQEILATRIPPGFKDVVDDFESIVEYKNKEGLRTCPDVMDICKEMGLKTEKGEGVHTDGKTTWIYLIPSLHPPKLNFSMIHHEPQAVQDFIGIYHFVNTAFFQNFAQQKYAQVHLVLKNDAGKLNRVHRFHVKAYYGYEKGILLTAMAQALSAGKPGAFWVVARPLIKTKELFE